MASGLPRCRDNMPLAIEADVEERPDNPCRLLRVVLVVQSNAQARFEPSPLTLQEGLVKDAADAAMGDRRFRHKMQHLVSVRCPGQGQFDAPACKPGRLRSDLEPSDQQRA